MRPSSREIDRNNQDLGGVLRLVSPLSRGARRNLDGIALAKSLLGIVQGENHLTFENEHELIVDRRSGVARRR